MEGKVALNGDDTNFVSQVNARGTRVCEEGSVGRTAVAEDPSTAVGSMETAAQAVHIAVTTASGLRMKTRAAAPFIL